MDIRLLYISQGTLHRAGRPVSLFNEGRECTSPERPIGALRAPRWRPGLVAWRSPVGCRNDLADGTSPQRVEDIDWYALRDEVDRAVREQEIGPSGMEGVHLVEVDAVDGTRTDAYVARLRR